MQQRPFKIFAPYRDRFMVIMATKDDAIQHDSEATALLGANRSAGLHQVHGNKTVIVTDAINRDVQADGMITAETNLALCIRWADCQNFVMYAPGKNIVGLLHAGWRGIVCGAIPEFFHVLKQRFAIDGCDVLVGAGPSLCTHCAAFTDPATELPTIDPQFFHGQRVDLRGVAEKQLQEAGVTKFERHPDCTRCNPETYWTYRGGDREAVVQGKTNMLIALCHASSSSA